MVTAEEVEKKWSSRYGGVFEESAERNVESVNQSGSLCNGLGVGVDEGDGVESLMVVVKINRGRGSLTFGKLLYRGSSFIRRGWNGPEKRDGDRHSDGLGRRAEGEGISSDGCSFFPFVRLQCARGDIVDASRTSANELYPEES